MNPQVRIAHLEGVAIDLQMSLRSHVQLDFSTSLDLWSLAAVTAQEGVQLSRQGPWVAGLDDQNIQQAVVGVGAGNQLKVGSGNFSGVHDHHRMGRGLDAVVVDIQNQALPAEEGGQVLKRREHIGQGSHDALHSP